jgi:hypothetical protein
MVVQLCLFGGVTCVGGGVAVGSSVAGWLRRRRRDPKNPIMLDMVSLDFLSSELYVGEHLS